MSTLHSRGARLLPTLSLLALSIGASGFLGGCLPNFQGPAGSYADLADPRDDPNHPESPATSAPNEAPPPADLAGTVLLPQDAFVTSGTATITLSATTQTLRLNEKKDITVTITPNGATGTATLSLAGAPAGVTAVFNPASVTLGAAPVTAVMTVTAASDMTPVASVATNVQAMVGASPSMTTFGVTVMPELVVYIQPAVVLTNNLTAFGAATIPVKLIGAGTAVTFINQDGIEHRIHADGTGGLAHQPNNMGANGGTYAETLTAVGVINFNCHIHAGMKGKIEVK